MIAQHNASSTLFQKMQTYLGYGNNPTPMGPQDFAVSQNTDFLNAYFQTLPYEIFSDPDENLFVTQEGGQGVYGPASMWQSVQAESQFQQLTSSIDQGLTPCIGGGRRRRGRERGGVRESDPEPDDEPPAAEEPGAIRPSQRQIRRPGQLLVRADDVARRPAMRRRPMGELCELDVKGLIDSFWRGDPVARVRARHGARAQLHGLDRQEQLPLPPTRTRSGTSSTRCIRRRSWITRRANTERRVHRRRSGAPMTLQRSPGSMRTTWRAGSQPERSGEGPLQHPVRSGRRDLALPRPRGVARRRATRVAAPLATPSSCAANAANHPTERQFLRCDDSMQLLPHLPPVRLGDHAEPDRRQRHRRL